jgi:hypothetical protein
VSGSQDCPAVQLRVNREPKALILPYDGGAAARDALRYAGDRVRRRHGEQLVLLLPRRPRCAILRRRDRLRLHANLEPDVCVCTLGDDVPAALDRLVADLPAPNFLVALEQRGTSRWYRDVACTLLTGRYGRCLALHLPSDGAPRRGALAATPISAAR